MLFVGDDWAEDHHDIEIEDESGRRTSAPSLDRTHRAALWFAVTRRDGSVILHHRHLRPVLNRSSSRPMDGIAATIWASRSHTLGVHGLAGGEPGAPSRLPRGVGTA